jgi:hypothetical protein
MIPGNIPEVNAKHKGICYTFPKRERNSEEWLYN